MTRSAFAYGGKCDVRPGASGLLQARTSAESSGVFLVASLRLPYGADAVSAEQKPKTNKRRWLDLMIQRSVGSPFFGLLEANLLDCQPLMSRR